MQSLRLGSAAVAAVVADVATRRPPFVGAASLRLWGACRCVVLSHSAPLYPATSGRLSSFGRLRVVDGAVRVGRASVLVLCGKSEALIVSPDGTVSGSSLAGVVVVWMSSSSSSSWRGVSLCMIPCSVPVFVPLIASGACAGGGAALAEPAALLASRASNVWLGLRLGRGVGVKG